MTLGMLLILSLVMESIFHTPAIHVGMTETIEMRPEDNRPSIERFLCRSKLSVPNQDWRGCCKAYKSPPTHLCTGPIWRDQISLTSLTLQRVAFHSKAHLSLQSMIIHFQTAFHPLDVKHDLITIERISFSTWRFLEKLKHASVVDRSKRCEWPLLGRYNPEAIPC